MDHYQGLIKSPLFQGISYDDLASLVKCLGCSFKEFIKDEIICHAGDPVRDIGIVVNGRVRILKEDAWGNSNIIAEITEGDMFAEAVVCAGVGILPVTVATVQDTLVCFADFSRILSTCASACVFHKHLIRNLIGVFARKNIALAGKMEHITKRTTREKLLSYLMEQSKANGGGSFDIPFDRQGLADFLSVERSALSAEMSKLRADGLIVYRKNRFELKRTSLS